MPNYKTHAVLINGAPVGGEWMAEKAARKTYELLSQTLKPGVVLTWYRWEREFVDHELKTLEYVVQEHTIS